MKKLTDEEIIALNLPTKKANRAEVDSFYKLNACLRDFEEAMETLDKRMHLIPDAWRDFKMVYSKLVFLMKLVNMTFEPDKRKHIYESGQRMMHKLIWVPEVTREKEKFLISDQELGILMVAAQDQCKVRMCSASECRACQLGKVLDSLSFVSRDKGVAWWELMASVQNGTNEDVKTYEERKNEK